MDSRLSGIERFIIFFRHEKKKIILMYSRISGLELCVSIRCENFRREY